MERQLELQKYHYFEEGNSYAGQRTKDWEKGLLLRYYVEPDKEASLLRAYAWTQDVCFDLAPDKMSQEYPLSEEGLDRAVEWLEEAYRQL